MNVLYVSRIISLWTMCVITIFISTYINNNSNSTFYRIGPQSDLIIMGIAIDTKEKYFSVILYAIINTVIKNMKNEIIMPWITLNIQNTENSKKPNESIAYEITVLAHLYGWFDWLIAMNILLAQIDMVVIELSIDIITNLCITRKYLKTHSMCESAYGKL